MRLEPTLELQEGVRDRSRCPRREDAAVMTCSAQDASLFGTALRVSVLDAGGRALAPTTGQSSTATGAAAAHSSSDAHTLDAKAR